VNVNGKWGTRAGVKKGNRKGGIEYGGREEEEEMKGGKLRRKGERRG